MLAPVVCSGREKRRVSASRGRRQRLAVRRVVATRLLTARHSQATAAAGALARQQVAYNSQLLNPLRSVTAVGARRRVDRVLIV